MKSSKIGRNSSTLMRSFLFDPRFGSRPRTPTRIADMFDVSTNIPSCQPLPSSPSMSASFNFRSHSNPARGWPYKFPSRRITGSPKFSLLGIPFPPALLVLVFRSVYAETASSASPGINQLRCAEPNKDNTSDNDPCEVHEQHDHQENEDDRTNAADQRLFPEPGHEFALKVAIWVFCNAAESKPWIPKDLGPWFPVLLPVNLTKSMRDPVVPSGRVHTKQQKRPRERSQACQG